LGVGGEGGRWPFRFGIGVLQAPSRSSWVEMARKAEDLGFSTLFMPDHLIDQLSPVPALACAAEATTTLRIGTHVLGNDFRHPLFVAKEAATLDLLSDGRLELGIGAGWLEADYAASGISFAGPGLRINRLAESVQILKRAFSGEQFSHHGQHYEVTEYRAYPLPAQRPHPPLLMGGGGRRMLELAAREADIVSINPNLAGGRFPETSEPEARGWTIAGEGRGSAATREKVEWVREAAGSRASAIELSCFARGVVTPKSADTVERIGRAVGMAADEILDSPHYLIGTPSQIAESLVRRRDQFAISYIILGQSSLDDFGRVIDEVSTLAPVSGTSGGHG